MTTKLISITYICIVILLLCKFSASIPIPQDVNADPKKVVTGNENNGDDSKGIINGSLNFNNPNSTTDKFTANKNNGSNSKGEINGSINIDKSRNGDKPKEINLNENIGSNSTGVIKGSINYIAKGPITIPTTPTTTKQGAIGESPEIPASVAATKEQNVGSFNIVDNGIDPLPIGNSKECILEGSVHYVGPDPDRLLSKCKIIGTFAAN
ncbi:hypothetical protein G9A89_004911 [Geosiphon pyriformis]|nr:hypothetical protein G9A89_004911 [Geosiphon pyriformis]